MIICVIESFEKQKGHYVLIAPLMNQSLEAVLELVRQKVEENSNLVKLRHKIAEMKTLRPLKQHASDETQAVQILNQAETPFTAEQMKLTLKELNLSQDSVLSLYQEEDLLQYQQ